MALLLLLLAALACASASAPDPASRPKRIVFEPEELRIEVAARVPELEPGLVAVPFEVDAETIARAREYVGSGRIPEEQVQSLIRFIRSEDGLGLMYDRGSLYTASETLEYGSGNCMALASVLIGLARGMGWRGRFVEMRVRDPEHHIEGDVAVVEQHMVAKISTGRVGAYVDYSGRLDYSARLKLVDDLRATAAYYVNDAYAFIRSAHQRGEPVTWAEVARRFEIATRIAPDSAEAWNNLGVARARLGEHESAEAAYLRSIELTGTGAAERNLALLQGRVQRQ
jgi:hypothetical protein